jgi:hypothetical protein
LTVSLLGLIAAFFSSPPDHQRRRPGSTRHWQSVSVPLSSIHYAIPSLIVLAILASSAQSSG